MLTVCMSSLKAKIVKQLDYLPETALKQVWDFIEFLTWRKKNREANSSEVDESLEKKQDKGWLETDLSNLGQ